MVKILLNGDSGRQYKISDNPESWKSGGEVIEVDDDVAVRFVNNDLATIVSGQTDVPDVQQIEQKPATVPDGVEFDQKSETQSGEAVSTNQTGTTTTTTE